MKSYLKGLPFTDLEILATMDKLKDSIGKFDVGESASVWIEKKLEYAQSIIEGAGVIGSNIETIRDGDLKKLTEEIKCEAIYFPLVYEGVPFLKSLRAHGNFQQLERTPTCIIDMNLMHGSLLDDVAEKIGSQAKRRILRFEKSGMVVTTLTGADAISAINEIEKNSWKALAKQNMHAKGQFEFYANLIIKKLVTVRVALYENVAVAYRIEKKNNETLYILKWSFDEKFRRYSPGFYLLTKDLQLSLNEEVRYIDLYGSPDPMKLILANRFVKRFDIIFPKRNRFGNILEERAMHDEIRKGTIYGYESVRTPYTN